MGLIGRMLRPVRSLMGRAVIYPDWLYTTAALAGSENAYALLSLIRRAAMFVASDKIDGDYLEFGVYQGRSFAQSYHALTAAFESRAAADDAVNANGEEDCERREMGRNMRFFAFDSFEGLPELEGVDRDGQDFAKGQYAAGIEEFRANVAAAGVPLERVICVPGWFDQSCTPETRRRLGITKASVIWVDCDLYNSAKSVLEFVGPILQDGTVLIFDDWFNYRGNPRRGEHRAFHEWKVTVPGFTFNEYQREGPWRMSFIASKMID
jgi:O-methyltransferase